MILRFICELLLGLLALAMVSFVGYVLLRMFFSILLPGGLVN